METETKAKRTAVKPKLDPLDALAQGDTKRIIALLLWKRRLQNPDMAEQITEEDLKGFDDCMTYQEIEPDVLIERPQGTPAQPMIPAAANRRAVPARPATPPRPFVRVVLVEKGTENGIRPVENNEEDFDAAKQMEQVRHARDNAQSLATRLVQQARTGEFSLSDMQDAAEALLTMAGALR